MELLSHDELVRLTPPERLTLISQLWDSLEDSHLPLTAAQRSELDLRLCTLDEDRREGITWAALKTELEQRCRFNDAVKRGEEALKRGEYLTHEQVGQRLERFL
jgi:putative addiction module component (TIGR02574 family)